MDNKFKNALALGGFIIFAIIVGLFVSRSESKTDTDNVEGNIQEVEETSTENLFFVYVVGAVYKPGVVEVEEGTRLYQVIQKAGGALETADLSKINLASIVKDEQKIIVPYIENKEDKVNDNSANVQAGVRLVNINTASEAELQTLNGIGASTAKKIVDYRNQNGDFNTVEEIMNVSGIGQSKFDSIKNDITV